MENFQASSFILVNYLFGSYFLGVSILGGIRAYQSFKQSDLNKPLVKVQQQDKQYLGAVYYTIMSLLCIVYGILMVSFQLFNEQNINQLIDNKNKLKDQQFTSYAQNIDHYYFNELYICDCLFFILFILIFTQLVLYDTFAYNNRSEIFKQAIVMAIKLDVPKQRLITIILYLIIQVIIIILFNVSSSNDYNQEYQDILLIIDLFWNIIQPLTLIIYQFYRMKHYQGNVIRSPKYRKDILQLNYLLVFFCIGRLLTVGLILSILIPILDSKSVYPSGVFYDENQLTYYQLSINIIVLTICLLLPFLASLQNGYKKILMIRFKQDSLISLDQNISLQQEQFEIETQKEQVRALSITDHTDKTIIEIRMNELKIANPFLAASLSQVQLGLLLRGIVQIGKYANKEFIIRKIYVQRLSQYIIEEMNQNIQGYRNISCKFIQPIKAISFDQENVHFFVPFFADGNINSLILSKDIIPDQDKKKITIQICIGMNYLYQQNPPVPHGHLIPNNIMITKSKDIKIIDFGLAPMKKYISLTTGYSTKCQYTAPELLKERSQTPLTNQAADIYSFGLIIWEIYHQKQAFLGLQLQELQKIVCDDKKRPKINDQVDEDIQNIIRACWQDEIDQRPTFEKVLSILNGNLDYMQPLT